MQINLKALGDATVPGTLAGVFLFRGGVVRRAVRVKGGNAMWLPGV